MPRLFNIRNIIAAVVLVAVSSLSADKAEAQGFGNNLGFLPYGFYQPYGANYGTSLRTPPYFATNPPVYYGARHTRPYGMSPFASPPMVAAGSGYRSHLHSPSVQRNTHLAPPVNRLHNDCGCSACLGVKVNRKVNDGSDIKLGAVQSNPFVTSSDRIAKK